MGKMLFDEQPLVVDRALAKLIGLNEAIVLQHVHYWLKMNEKTGKNYINGRFWTYNSIRKWHEESFEFWSFNTVQRVFSRLEKLGLLISDNFNKDPRDKTKWYTINYAELEVLMQQQGKRDYPKTQQCTTPEWDNALPQNGVMEYPKIGQPLPNTTTNITTNNNNNIIINDSNSNLDSIGTDENTKQPVSDDDDDDVQAKVAKILKKAKELGLEIDKNLALELLVTSNKKTKTILDAMKAAAIWAKEKEIRNWTGVLITAVKKELKPPPKASNTSEDKYKDLYIS